MTVSDSLTTLMTAIRKSTHTDSKMSIKDATSLIASYLSFKCENITYQVRINDLTDPGVYYSTGKRLSDKPANIKNEDTITLLVFQDQFANKIQIFVGSNNIFWVRRWENNSYTAWQEVGGVVNLILTATFERRRAA